MAPLTTPGIGCGSLSSMGMGAVAMGEAAQAFCISSVQADSSWSFPAPSHLVCSVPGIPRDQGQEQPMPAGLAETVHAAPSPGGI